MQKITFVIPARNNLEFLKLSYDSLKKLKGDHEILVLNDASKDGTTEWLESLNDKNLLVYHNKGPERIGIVGMFDKGIALANTDIIMAFHADMVAAPDLDKHILKNLKEKTVVSATRVEPPIHPDGPEKILVDFGSEAEDFVYESFAKWVKEEHKPKHKRATTQGIFAPWCMYKKDFLAVGGHDNLFAPQSREDSDLFNRFVLNGYNLIQTWEGLVYHFTSRGSRFNKHSGGDTGVDSPEWKYTNAKNERNFARKWGSLVRHTPFLRPIVLPKYNISFAAKNCTREFLEVLEPWCDQIYCDTFQEDIEAYIEVEKYNTTYDLTKRIKPLTPFRDPSDTTVNIDCSNFVQEDFEIIINLSQIIWQYNQIGRFKMKNLEFHIRNLDEHQQALIVSKKTE